jgi:uncharacterized membrane protein YgcG
MNMMVGDLQAGVPVVAAARVLTLRNVNDARNLFVYACLGAPRAGAGAAAVAAVPEQFFYVDAARALLNPPRPQGLAAGADLRAGGRTVVFQSMAKGFWATVTVRLGAARVHGLILRFQKHCTALVVHLINSELAPLVSAVAAGHFTAAHLAAELPAFEQWASLQTGAALKDLAALFFSMTLGITHAVPRGGGAPVPLIFNDLSTAAMAHPALRVPLLAYQSALWGGAPPVPAPGAPATTGASIAALFSLKQPPAPALWRRLAFSALLSKVQQDWRTQRGFSNRDGDPHPGEFGLHQEEPFENHELLPLHVARGAPLMGAWDFYTGWRPAGGGDGAGAVADHGAGREPFSLHPCGDKMKFYPRAFSALPVAALQTAPHFQVSQSAFSAMVGPTLKALWLSDAGNHLAPRTYPYTEANGGVPLEVLCCMGAGARNSIVTNGRRYAVLYQRLPRDGGEDDDDDSDGEDDESEGEGGGPGDGGSQPSNSSDSGASGRSGGSGGGGGGGPQRPPPPPPALARAQAYTDRNELALLHGSYLAGTASRRQMRRGGRKGIVRIGADPGANFVLVATATVPGYGREPLVYKLTAGGYYHAIRATRRGHRTNVLWAPLAATITLCFEVPTRTAHGGQLRDSLRHRMEHAGALVARAQTRAVRSHELSGARLRAGAQWRFWAAILRACAGVGVPGVAYGNAFVGNVRGHAPGPWRELMHVCARINQHGYVGRLWEWLTSRLHSVCRQRMATVYGPWFSGGRGWALGEPLPHATARVGGMFWCESCSVFVSRDVDATYSMRDIDTHYLRHGERLPVYTAANRGVNPDHFHIGGRMRGVPAALQFAVDALPVGGQALIARFLEGVLGLAQAALGAALAP